MGLSGADLGAGAVPGCEVPALSCENAGHRWASEIFSERGFGTALCGPCRRGGTGATLKGAPEAAPVAVPAGVLCDGLAHRLRRRRAGRVLCRTGALGRAGPALTRGAGSSRRAVHADRASCTAGRDDAQDESPDLGKPPWGSACPKTAEDDAFTVGADRRSRTFSARSRRSLIDGTKNPTVDQR